MKDFIEKILKESRSVFRFENVREFEIIIVIFGELCENRGIQNCFRNLDNFISWTSDDNFQFSRKVDKEKIKDRKLVKVFQHLEKARLDEFRQDCRIKIC